MLTRERQETNESRVHPPSDIFPLDKVGYDSSNEPILWSRSTSLNPLHDLNKAIDYIEEHLEDDLDLTQAAEIACCTPYQFSRLFSTLAGYSVLEYVRRRRMTLAALEVQMEDPRVIDLAVKYGYTSADAFSRAFASVHGVPPSQSKSAPLKAYPRVSFQLTIQGANEMEYRIVTKEAFRVLGIHKRVRLIFKGVNPEVQAMFESLDPTTIGLMKSLSNTEPRGIIQATTDFAEGREEGSSIEHYIGVASTQSCPEQLSGLEVSAGDWVVFTSRGPAPQAMQDTWARIYSEWLPGSNYRHRGGPELLWCEHADLEDPLFHSEIWIPVEAV